MPRPAAGLCCNRSRRRYRAAVSAPSSLTPSAGKSACRYIPIPRFPQLGKVGKVITMFPHSLDTEQSRSPSCELFLLILIAGQREALNGFVDHLIGGFSGLARQVRNRLAIFFIQRHSNDRHLAPLYLCYLQHHRPHPIVFPRRCVADGKEGAVRWLSVLGDS